MNRIVLIADGDAAIGAQLEMIVRSNSYGAVRASSGDEALELFANDSFSLVLLDIELPVTDGFQVIEQIRKQQSRVPIMVVSARVSDSDVLRALEIGADDYIAKPFNPVILGAKIKALLRRSTEETDEIKSELSAGPFTINTKKFQFFKNGNEILLTSREMAIMKIFLENHDTLITMDMLRDRVWEGAPVRRGLINSHIYHLRKKIEDLPEKPVFIQNVRGIGFLFLPSNISGF